MIQPVEQVDCSMDRMKEKFSEGRENVMVPLSRCILILLLWFRAQAVNGGGGTVLRMVQSATRCTN